MEWNGGTRDAPEWRVVSLSGSDVLLGRLFGLGGVRLDGGLRLVAGLRLVGGVKLVT